MLGFLLSPFPHGEEQGGPGGDGCIILYYRKPKPVQSGALRTSDGRDLLDALDRRMIV